MEKRALYQLGAVLCLLVFLPGLAMAQENHHFSMAGFDGDDSSHVWEDNGFFARMEERTGISFSFEQYTDYEQWQAAKDAMFAEDGVLPEALFKADLTYEEQLRYTDSGQLLDLAPLLAEHAPNLWALLSENPSWLQAITLPNGKIGALPGIHTLPVQNAMWINQAWLKALKLDMPKDAESLRDVLRAFQQQDPNRNRKKDEIPMTFLGVWDIKFLAHAFGMPANDYNIFVKDGQVVYAPLTEEYSAFLVYLRELYQEKLLDQEGFYTIEALRTPSEENTAVVHGVFFGPNPLSLYGIEQAKDYVLLPPLAYQGTQGYRRLAGEITQGAFALTSACTNPEALLAWVDVLYTEEGAIQAMAGNEAEDYLIDEEGNWAWADSQDVPTLREITLVDTGNMPWLFPLDFYNRFEEQETRRINEELAKLQNDLVQSFPQHSLTSAQRETVLPLQQELGKYVDESLARFVLGQVELNEEQLEAFHQGLEQRGATEFTAFWQALYQHLQQAPEADATKTGE